MKTLRKGVFYMTTIQENIIEFTDNQPYKISRVDIHRDWEDCQEVGELLLLNLNSSELEHFTIYTGNDEGTSFYVCMPTGETDEDDEEILDEHYLEDFDIHLAPFNQLSKKARYNAANEFKIDCEQFFKTPVTIREAYRTLDHANQVYLYDLDGVLQTNGGMY